MNDTAVSNTHRNHILRPQADPALRPVGVALDPVVGTPLAVVSSTGYKLVLLLTMGGQMQDLLKPIRRYNSPLCNDAEFQRCPTLHIPDRAISAIMDTPPTTAGTDGELSEQNWISLF